MPRPFEESWYLRFHGLMPFRAREILLVSSPYDAFTMEEDGRLMTRLFAEYSELNLSELPTIIRAYNAETAFQLLNQRRFDLVITMANLADMDVGAFAAGVKKQFPNVPVVLFTFNDVDLSTLREWHGASTFDQVFLWTGDANVLIASIKLVEDERNLDHDTASGVRVIIVVEDSVRRYSTFLSLLYVELLRQAGTMVAEGVNDLHKRMRMRARPKILLATTYEEAWAKFSENRHNVLSVITDVRFPRGGKLDSNAGFTLVERMREQNPDLPILVQSAEPDACARAAEMQTVFGDKNSANILSSIRRFLREDLGFGDFVFRLPDRTEVGRAADMYEMERILPEIPDESIEFHASHNHFSMWLMARGMFMLARELRPRRVEEFANIDGLRQHLISVLRRGRRQEHLGAISDFSGKQQQEESFIRLGAGSIGGKGRAIAFVNSTLRPQRLADRFDKLEIRVPQTVAVGTDEFDRFIDDNGLADLLREPPPDHEIRRRFLEAHLAPELERRIRLSCIGMSGPLAVRSSSILEDSRSRPFAGIYATYMLPNNHPNPAVRAQELFGAIKAVFASTYCQDARAYMGSTPHSIEEEQMGVVIQEVIGRPHGERFYPDFAGVAYSYNFYPVAGQAAEEGVASVALGLGRMVVDGGKALQFSPARPRILPQFSTARDFLEHGQSSFYALDLAGRADFVAGKSPVRLFELAHAEEDGVLSWVGSVYVPEDDTIRDTLRQHGPRVVTFNNILKWETVPLAEALNVLLEVMRRGFGHGVEIEFAVDMGRGADRKPVLFVLQVRPQAGGYGGSVPAMPELLPEDAFLCRTDAAIGHGVIENLHDVVYVRKDFKDRGSVAQAAEEVGELNARLQREERPYLLIGPGRWGSSDPSLGIPIVWSQIAGAKVIVETMFEGRPVEPSQGSHFFHNVLSMELGYLTLSLPEQAVGQRLAQLDREWLEAQPAASEKPTVRHVRLERPLTVYLDGRAGKACIIKQERPT